MKSGTDEIIENIFSLVNKILLGEKKRIFEFNGVKLYPSETHLMLLIHREGNTNATRMAERLSVTKGAVSQILSRLEEKGILQKHKDPYNKNEITIEFTKPGKEALKHFLTALADFRNHYDRYLAALSGHDRNVINSFLSEAFIITDKIMGGRR